MYFLTILAIHTALCITLVGLVLLQQGKGADAGATFGGGSSNSVFGAAGATDFITRLTTSLAIGFMITSILLIRAYSADGGQVLSPSVATPSEAAAGSVMERVAEQPAVEKEAAEEEGAAGDLTLDVEESTETEAAAGDEAPEAAAAAVEEEAAPAAEESQPADEEVAGEGEGAEGESEAAKEAASN